MVYAKDNNNLPATTVVFYTCGTDGYIQKAVSNRKVPDETGCLEKNAAVVLEFISA